jgi:hypothetical protein
MEPNSELGRFDRVLKKLSWWYTPGLAVSGSDLGTSTGLSNTEGCPCNVHIKNALYTSPRKEAPGYSTSNFVPKRCSLPTIESQVAAVLNFKSPSTFRCKLWLPVSAGAVAGASGTVITYPIETMRAHMAVGGCSYRKVAADIVRAHGHRGFWNGYRAGVVSLLVYLYAQVLQDRKGVLGIFALLDLEPDEYQGIPHVIGVAVIVTTAPCDIMKPWWHDICTPVVGATLAPG